MLSGSGGAGWRVSGFPSPVQSGEGRDVGHLLRPTGARHLLGVEGAEDIQAPVPQSRTRWAVGHDAANAHLAFIALDDPSTTVRRLQAECLRRMTVAERHAITEDLTATVVALSRRAIAARMPGASRGAVMLRWIEPVYGKELAMRVAPLQERLGVPEAR